MTTSMGELCIWTGPTPTQNLRGDRRGAHGLQLRGLAAPRKGPSGGFSPRPLHLLL